MVIAFLRTIILYAFLILGIRLMGKRQVGELEPSELVLALLVADLAAVPMQDFGIPLLTGLIPIFTLLCLTMALSVLTMKSARLRTALCGRPSIIVDNGVLRQSEMRKNRFTLDELMEELRLKGFADLAAVKYAILETSGSLSILLRTADSPATPRALGTAVREEGTLPLILVNDGRVIRRALAARGLDRGWLERQLRQRGLKGPGAVFLMTIDERGTVVCVPKE